MTAGQFDGAGSTPGAVPPPPSAPPPPAGPTQPWLAAGMTPPTFAEDEAPANLAAPRTLRERWQKLTGSIGAALAALWKLKILAILLKLKFLTFFGSMFVSFAAYAWIYGWRFAVGLVALLVVHEFGHVLVLRARGAKVSLPTFVPLLGAYVKAAPKTVYDSALGGLAGPGVGGLGALVALAIWSQNNQPVYRAVAAFGFLMNLFNLLPVSILDGGNVWRALRGKLSNGKGSERIYAMSVDQRRLVWAIYIALIVVLGYATKVTYFHQDLNN